MRKIGGKSFWIIVVISIASLMLLTLGVIFLTKKSEKEFYSSGYIINSTASKSDKYYFDDNTVYKENVFNEYVFNDVDNKEVNTSKNNFIHYSDNSMSFMKNGVILDLDNLNTTLVPYYNITDKSIIKYNNGSYYIQNGDKTLIISNFLGRITDNKYIVAGSDINIKLSGNDNFVKGDYFEILFVEDGIVKIENQEGSYQTISDGSVIYVGKDVKIDLGTKNVSLNNENKLSLSEMTIDGNENIDIEPEDDKVDNKEENNDVLENDGTTNDAGNTDKNQQGANNNDEVTSVIKKEVSVDLITAEVGINSISASFQVIDTDNFIKGDLIFSLTNVNTGEKYIKTLAKTPDLQEVPVGLLSPDTNYLMEISEENGGIVTQYFNKVFKTESLDVKLIRDMVTIDSLSYSLDFGTTDVKSAKVSLYDKDNNLIGYRVLVNGEEGYAVFEGLERNTTYNVLVDSFVFNNLNHASNYTIRTSDDTLKMKPELGDISAQVDVENNSFILKVEDAIDDDKAITKYTYEIYDDASLSSNDVKPVYSFVQEHSELVTLKIGEHGLEEKKNYKYKVIAEYFDNYKYGEIESILYGPFKSAGRPTIDFEEEIVDFNQIKGKIILKDESCLIPMEGRSCNDGKNGFTIYYKSLVSPSDNGEIKGNFVQSKDNPYIYEMDLDLINRSEDTEYRFEVWADKISFQDGRHIGDFSVKTMVIDSLKVRYWTDNSNYSKETPITVKAELVPTIEGSNHGDKLASLTFKLYGGNFEKDDNLVLIGEFTDNVDVRNKYYENEFTLTSNMFGIDDLEMLKELSGDVLYDYYTIEITDAKDNAIVPNTYTIVNNKYAYRIPLEFILEDRVDEPTITVNTLTNDMMKKGNYGIEYDEKLSNVVVGYEVIVSFNKSMIEKVLKDTDASLKNINFYVTSNGKELSLSEEDKVVYLTDDTDENGYYTYTKYFFLDYGTEYNVSDNDLRRGNNFTFSYDISIDMGEDNDLIFPYNKVTSEEMKAEKDEPEFILYIEKSSSDSITYKYKIFDDDKALYKDPIDELGDDEYYLYYTVNDAEENKVKIIKQDGYGEFTLTGLSNSSIYNIYCKRASGKWKNPDNKDLGKYLFDGYYSADDYEPQYELEYGNFDNRLKIIINDNEFLDRVSAYLVTLTANGTQPYLTVVSNLSKCDDKKCIIIDYANIEEQFKKKDVEVTLEALYDTGLIGFGQISRLGGYFEGLGLVDSENSSKVGYVFQNTNTTEMGKYVYLNEKGAIIGGSSVPQGILGFDIDYDNWKLTTVNMINIPNNKFVNYGDITKKVYIVPSFSGIIENSTSSTPQTFNPKVLDKYIVQTDDNKFRFNSITPKVSSEVTHFINGVNIDINLSVTNSMLESDFVKENGKYKLYVDVYAKCIDDVSGCKNGYLEIATKDVYFDKSNNNESIVLNDINIIGLDPDATYYYKIFALMHKDNGDAGFKTPLFDYNRSGYVEYIKEFKTLGKDDIYKDLSYNYNSVTSPDNYSNRKLNINAILKNNINFDIRYELYDKDGNLEFEGIVYNSDIIKNGSVYNAKYIQDITGNDFVFGDNFHKLVIYAVTTDLHKELELYNDFMKEGGFGTGDTKRDIHELIEPKFTITTEATIDESFMNYGILSTISVNDSDKVINDGIYNVELWNDSDQNACTNPDDCRAIVNLKNGTCTVSGNNNSCVFEQGKISLSFDNLKSGTPYKIVVIANTYRNNVSLKQKEERIELKKDQYTMTDLGFTLGEPAAGYTSDDVVFVKFIGSHGLQEKITRLVYNIEELGENGGKIDEGEIKNTGDKFTLDSNGEVMITIPIKSGKTLGETNRIKITYYYMDDNNEEKVLTINGLTNIPYPLVKGKK